MMTGFEATKAGDFEDLTDDNELNKYIEIRKELRRNGMRD